MKDLAIIGIDSLDPYIILKYRKNLPNFSKLLDHSQTFISKSIFPVDTIPAWGSIYTGLHPGNHGLLYTYDIFDPNLNDMKGLKIDYIRGKTFWDYASTEGYKSVIVFPTFAYPAWKINGIMVAKSFFDKRIDWIKTERDVDTYPKEIKNKYQIPDQLVDLWGGFPGINNLLKFAEYGKNVIEKEKLIGLELFKKEKWNLFFIYFSHLDIIQHRLWRFFDENDPTHCKNHLSGIILDYYKIYDNIIGEFVEIYPNINFIVMSDHGHMIRPINSVNINELLRRKKYLISKDRMIHNKIRNISLEVIKRLNIEHRIIKSITKHKSLGNFTKSIYSSSTSINRSKSLALLSNFAGIKSYPHGGIEINKDLVHGSEYERIKDDIIECLLKLKTNEGYLLNWAKKREELYPGKFTENMYPDIIFELKENYGIGWDLNSDLFGFSHDHNVASGGHRKEAVFLIRLINRGVEKKNLSIVDITPTILDLLDINLDINLDGHSILKL